VAEILGKVLPEVFHRFGDAAARPVELKKGIDALLTADNLRGLPSVFSSLRLVHEEQANTVFSVDTTPLVDVRRRIEERARYGDIANGRSLADEFAKEPFGWDFEAIQLFTLALVRAGAITVTGKGRALTSARGRDAQEIFGNNNQFKSAAFQPKVGIDFTKVAEAGVAFRDTFGREARELSARALAEELRQELAARQDEMSEITSLLSQQQLPGGGVLEDAIAPIRTILRGSDDDAVATFNASHRVIKDALRRSAELRNVLSASVLEDLKRARASLQPYQRHELVVTDELDAAVKSLEDLLARETFFRDLAAIGRQSDLLEREYERQYTQAADARVRAYAVARQQLAQAAGWERLDSPQQAALAAALDEGSLRPERRVPIPQLRSDLDACDTRLRSAIRELQMLLDGERLAPVDFGSYFKGGIETEEQLDAALTGIREECAKLIGAGKKIVLR
jgi:hypothetical protein